MSKIMFPLHSVFLALPLEGEAKCKFRALQEEIREWEEILSFQNPQSPHMTLMFWPEIGELEFQGIVEQSGKIAARHPPFSVNATGIDTFGSRGEDKVLFLTVAFSDELARIKKACPWSDGKPFAPHITVARIRHAQRFNVEKKKILKTLESPSFPIPFDRLRLYGEVDGRKQAPLLDFIFVP